MERSDNDSAGCGPFEMSASAANHELPSPTLFMDRAGSVHRSLDGSVMEAKRSRSPNVHAPLMDNSLAVSGALDYPGPNRYKLNHFGRGYRPSALLRTLPVWWVMLPSCTGYIQ